MLFKATHIKHQMHLYMMCFLRILKYRSGAVFMTFTPPPVDYHVVTSYLNYELSFGRKDNATDNFKQLGSIVIDGFKFRIHNSNNY